MSNYIPKEEIDDIEDDEMDTDFIDARRSPSKLRMMAKIQQDKPLLYVNEKLKAFGNSRGGAAHANKVRAMQMKREKNETNQTNEND